MKTVMKSMKKISLGAIVVSFVLSGIGLFVVAQLLANAYAFPFAITGMAAIGSGVLVLSEIL